MVDPELCRLHVVQDEVDTLVSVGKGSAFAAMNLLGRFRVPAKTYLMRTHKAPWSMVCLALVQNVYDSNVGGVP